ncbi:MAG: hypothetical protein ACJ757_12090 [Gaiellaceae bacterium]
MWQAGETILRREVLNDGRAWLEIPVIVVRDEPDLLATYVPEGAPFHFPEGDWPTSTGRHPWHGRGTWQGHGVLMLQRPGEAHAIWISTSGSAKGASPSSSSKQRGLKVVASSRSSRRAAARGMTRGRRGGRTLRGHA